MRKLFPTCVSGAFIVPLSPTLCGPDHFSCVSRSASWTFTFLFARCIAGSVASAVASGHTADCWGWPRLATQKGVVAVSGGENHTLFLMADGSVEAFGDNHHGQTVVPKSQVRNQAIRVAAGTNHSLVLLRDRTVVGFGSNIYGETDPIPWEALPGGVGVADIAAGPDYSLFLLKNGSVLGTGDTEHAPLFSLPGAILHNVSSISCRWRLCGAVKAGGELILWGYNNSETSADTTISLIPPEVEAAGVATLSAGYSHVAAMLRNGQGVVWGLNDDGQACFSDDIAPDNVQSIAAGGFHTVALLKNGQLKAFGYNGNSQIDIPETVSSAAATGVAAGHTFSCALLSLPPEPPPRTWFCCFQEPVSCTSHLVCAHVCASTIKALSQRFLFHACSASAAFAAVATCNAVARCVCTQSLSMYGLAKIVDIAQHGCLTEA
jgi:alpha-tubulin suppressor-like RCC1 family protein